MVFVDIIGKKVGSGDWSFVEGKHGGRGCAACPHIDDVTSWYVQVCEGTESIEKRRKDKAPRVLTCRDQKQRGPEWHSRRWQRNQERIWVQRKQRRRGFRRWVDTSVSLENGRGVGDWNQFWAGHLGESQSSGVGEEEEKGSSQGVEQGRGVRSRDSSSLVGFYR